MAKYYVECGPVRMVLAAESIDHAALLAIDRTLDSHRWIYDDSGLSDRDRHDHLMLESLLLLAPSVRVSEQGFGRTDGALVGTPETVERWHELMTAASRLHAAIPPTESQSSQHAVSSTKRTVLMWKGSRHRVHTSDGGGAGSGGAGSRPVRRPR